MSVKPNFLIRGGGGPEAMLCWICRRAKYRMEYVCSKTGHRRTALLCGHCDAPEQP